jgi:hypothetical protein
VKLEILGSAGAAPTPHPGCDCRVCTGLQGPNILFDTPEESGLQLERAGIGEIAAWIDGLTYDDHVRLGAQLGVEFA